MCSSKHQAYAALVWATGWIHRNGVLRGGPSPFKGGGKVGRAD
jgi:hypothetical protein